MNKLASIISIAAALLWTGISAAQQIGTIGVGDITYSAKESNLRAKEKIISELDRGINAALTKTRKFTVLDHPQLEQYLAKQGLTLDGYYTNKYQKAGTYDQVGLDYILATKVTDFKLIKQQRGELDTSLMVLDMDYTLYGVADVTDDSSSSVSTQLTIKTKASAAGKRASQDGDLDQLIEAASVQLANSIIVDLFPVRVMKINDDKSVVLNYGKGVLEAGDTVLIYPEEANVASIESGKVKADSLATLQIVSTDKKFATAQVLVGAETVQKGLPGRVLKANL